MRRGRKITIYRCLMFSEHLLAVVVAYRRVAFITPTLQIAIGQNSFIGLYIFTNLKHGLV